MRLIRGGKRGSVAHGLSLKPSNRPDMTELIVLIYPETVRKDVQLQDIRPSIFNPRHA